MISINKLFEAKFKGVSTTPSKGLTKKEKSRIVSSAKSGKDIGNPGKKFKEVAAKAAKQYGSEEAGKRVAAAAMWKNIKRGSMYYPLLH